MARTLVSQRLLVVSSAVVFLLASAALPCASRELLQVDDDLLGADELPPAFQLVSNNTNVVAGNTIPFLNCSIEVDTTTSFDTPWREGRLGNWRDGNTRWNVTASFIDGSTVGDHTATLQSAPCSRVTTETLYVAPGNNTVTGGTLAVSGGQASFSLTFPFLIDYDAVESVAVYSGATTSGAGFIGCVDLTPPAPDFPSDWSATVEVNIGEWGLTLPSRQMYSQTLNKARMDFTSGIESERIILTDYNTNQLTFIRPSNATYPHGYCSGSEIPNFLNYMTDDTNTSLLDTSAYLRFDYSKVSYVPGHVTVRGIECEAWAYDSQSAGPFAGNFTMTFYFPVNYWRTGGRSSSYHRLLKEIHITGTTENGNDVDTRIEYVNFKPQNFTSDSAAFNVCALAPQGTNCNCTRQQIAALAGLQLDSDLDDVIIDNGTLSSQDGNCELQAGSIPHGFVSAQAGPYVGLVIIGMVAGALFTFLGTWLYYRRTVGVQLTDRMSHTKFDVGGN